MDGIASPERKASAIAEKTKREARSFLFVSRILKERSVNLASLITANGIKGRTSPKAKITFLKPFFEDDKTVKGETMQKAAKRHRIA